MHFRLYYHENVEIKSQMESQNLSGPLSAPPIWREENVLARGGNVQHDSKIKTAVTSDRVGGPDPQPGRELGTIAHQQRDIGKII